MRWTWVVLLTLTGGCDGIRLEDFLGTTTLTRVSQEPPGEHCAHGGQAVLAGTDVNHDGRLSDSEVASTEYVCASAPVRALTRTRDEGSGTRCEHGGRAVESGLDTDADGTLGDTEVTGTEYICATPWPGVLVRTRHVARGEACPRGGQVTHAGNDVNADGILGDDEITREVYGCLEPETVLTRVVSLGTRYNSECRSNTVYAVESGPDLDEDGILDDGETRAVSRLCNPLVPILARQREEPPGLHCLAGGVAVLSGGDLDRSLVLEEREVLATHYVCQSAATHDGTYELLDATDVAALQDIARIRGGLIISSKTAIEVVLPGLESVEGALDVHDNLELVRLSLPSLRFVQGDLLLQNNPVLASVGIGPTVPPLSHPVSVEGSLRVSNNSQLTSLTGMTAVAPRGFWVADNTALDSAGAFTFAEHLPSGMYVARNPALRELPVTQASLMGSVTIEDNPSLESLSGLRALSTVQYDFFLIRNEALQSVSTLENLWFIGRELIVQQNTHLQSLEIPRLVQVGGLTLEDNANVGTVGPMRGLRDVGSSMRVVGNPRLQQFLELNSLLSINGSLTLANNSLLSDLSGFQPLAAARYLSVTGNNALLDLSGLRGLRELDGLDVRDNISLTTLGLDALAVVRSGIMVTGNTHLPSCLATALAEAVHTGPLDERVIENNDETATCGP